MIPFINTCDLAGAVCAIGIIDIGLTVVFMVFTPLNHFTEDVVFHLFVGAVSRYCGVRTAETCIGHWNSLILLLFCLLKNGFDTRRLLRSLTLYVRCYAFII